ncbi:hypothetical protein E8E11_007941 [Didymella keratinophila]|nr:hypothetical protein E8E11_007941 [Didymella keratinophila]
MADEDLANPPEVLHPSANLQSESSEFLRSVKLLSGAARGTAQKLHAIDYLQRSPSSMTELILEVNALATILSGLEDDLLLEGVLRATDRTLMWTNEHHKNLTRSTEECDDVLRALRRAVRIADEGFRVVASWKRPKDYIEHLQLDDGSQALETIVRCSHLVSKTRVIVRHTALSRIEILNNDEIQELLRLTQALQHPDLHAIWTRKDEPLASRQLERCFLPSARNPTMQIEPSKDETPSTSSPPDQASSDSSVKPVLTPDCVLTAPQGDTKPGEVTFGEPSVIKPTSSSSLFVNLQPNSAFANYSQPQTGLFGPKPPHLEAYVLRPTVQTTGSTSILSYGDEPLRLHEAAVQAQLRSLGPEFSVVNELLNLHPQQLNLMQGRASGRDGDIVSIQYGRPVDLQTIVGCIQVKPVIYIVSTTTTLPLVRFGSFQQSLPTDGPLLPSGSGPRTGGGGLFDRVGCNIAAPKPDIFGNLQSGTDKPALAPPSESLFGNLGLGTKNPTSVPAPDNTSTEQLQTITANKEWNDSDESLEEIRLADY